MQQYRRAFLVAMILAVSTSAGSASRAADISGTWLFSVDMGGTQGTPTFVFKQQGETVTGTVSNARGQQKISGTVKGDKAVFGFEVTRDGQPFKATYRGIIESPTKMTGTVDFSGALTGSGTWAAAKK
jgi:hypothetical protein